MRSGKPTPVAELVKRLASSPELERGLTTGRVLLAWSRVVGEPLSRLTWPLAFKDGVLWVGTGDHVLAHQLAYQRGTLVRRINRELGEDRVREIRFRVAAPGGEPPAPAPDEPRPPAEEPLSAEDEARLLEVIRPLPEGLKRPALALGRAVFRRARGPSCPVCRAPAEDDSAPCPRCRVLLEKPAVREGADRICRGLPPRLAGDPLLAARYLAEASLRRRMEELARRAVSDDGAVPELLEASLRWLSLTLEREPRPEDLSRLPPRVASLLRSKLSRDRG